MKDTEIHAAAVWYILSFCIGWDRNYDIKREHVENTWETLCRSRYWRCFIMDTDKKKKQLILTLPFWNPRTIS